MCEKREPPVGDCLLWTPQLLLITAGSCASAFSRGRGRGFEGMGFVTGGRGGGHCARVEIVRAFLCMKSQDHPPPPTFAWPQMFYKSKWNIESELANRPWDLETTNRPIERRPLCFLRTVSEELSSAKHTPLYCQQHLFQPV